MHERLAFSRQVTLFNLFGNSELRCLKRTPVGFGPLFDAGGVCYVAPVSHFSGTCWVQIRVHEAPYMDPRSWDF